MSEERSGKKQIEDLTGLFTGDTKIEDNRIVPADESASSESSPDRAEVDVHVHVDEND